MDGEQEDAAIEAQRAAKVKDCMAVFDIERSLTGGGAEIEGRVFVVAGGARYPIPASASDSLVSFVRGKLALICGSAQVEAPTVRAPIVAPAQAATSNVFDSMRARAKLRFEVSGEPYPEWMTNES